MAMQHHGEGSEEQNRLIKRFLEQAQGKSNRAYPNWQSVIER